MLQGLPGHESCISAEQKLLVRMSAQPIVPVCGWILLSFVTHDTFLSHQTCLIREDPPAHGELSAELTGTSSSLVQLG